MWVVLIGCGCVLSVDECGMCFDVLLEVSSTSAGVVVMVGTITTTAVAGTGGAITSAVIALTPATPTARRQRIF